MPKCDWLVRFVCFSLKFAFEAVIYLASHPSTTDFPSLGPSLMILSTSKILNTSLIISCSMALLLLLLLFLLMEDVFVLFDELPEK